MSAMTRGTISPTGVNTPQLMQATRMITHQKHTARLALDRTSHPTRAASTRSLLDDLSTLASCLLLTVPSLSPAERQFLYDIRRDEARFPVRGLQRLVELSRRSLRPAHREKMAELLRAHCITTDEAMDIVAASIAETQAQGKADVSMHVFLHERTRANQERAEADCAEHFAAMRRLLDVLKTTAVHN